MEQSKNNNVDETVRIFNLQVDKQMLPTGTEISGRNKRMVSYEEIPKIILGPVRECNFKSETGEMALAEKMHYQGTGFERGPDPDLQVDECSQGTVAKSGS